MLFIFGLFLLAHANVSDPDACALVRKRSATECMSESCSGLLTTGVGSNSVVRDPKECEKICADLSVKFTESETVCAVPMPEKKPESLLKKSGGQADAQTSAAAKAGEAEKNALDKQKKYSDAAEYGKNLQNERIGTSEDLLRRWDGELNSGKSHSFPADRAKWKNDKALVDEAKKAASRNEPFSAEKASRAYLPAIRGELNQFSRARKLESNSNNNLGAIALALAQLAQMKKNGQANAEALDQSRIQPMPIISSFSAEKKKPQGLLSPEFRGEEKSGSDLAPGNAGSKAEAGGENGAEADSGKTQAQSPNRESLKAKLRELLRKKMAAEGLSEMPEEFWGELDLSSDPAPGDATTDQAVAMAAEEEIFRLAGQETDSEIRRLRNELQDELARSEGVLAAESLSLFERVKAAHLACAARQCVRLAHEIAMRF